MTLATFILIPGMAGDGGEPGGHCGGAAEADGAAGEDLREVPRQQGALQGGRRDGGCRGGGGAAVADGAAGQDLREVPREAGRGGGGYNWDQATEDFLQNILNPRDDNELMY